MPHDVPEIGDRPTAECVERGKSRQEKVFSFLIEFRKQIRHEKTRKSAADDGQECDAVTYVFRREENAEDVQGAGAVVGEYRPEVRTHADVPGEEQALSGEDLVSKFHQERCVLVIAVHRQDHVLTGGKRVHL